ncbi:MAG TPA: hypothetical protein VGG79_20160, partial [Roseiarcus sp.]
QAATKRAHLGHLKTPVWGMRVNTHILSGRRNSTKLADHAAVAASFNPRKFKLFQSPIRRGPD